MNDTMRTLLHYVVEGDMKKSRDVAKLILQTNKTAKDQQMCEKLLAKMEEQDAKGVQIPYNLQAIIQQSVSPYGFQSDRYYLTEREKQLLSHIKRMYSAGTIMAAKGIHYTNAVLLHGVSGTGKTTFAQYVADALNLPFFYVSITQLVNSYMGKTGQNLELVFQFASTMPCVLVLDEIDQIGTKRGLDGGVDGEMKRVLISVMQNLDRLPNNVILIAATNRPDVIDSALKRRFPVKHEVRALTDTEACAFTNMYLSRVGLDWKGELMAFLSFDVYSKQDEYVPSGEYTPAAITDSLNEKIAQAIEKDPENPIVILN